MTEEPRKDPLERRVETVLRRALGSDAELLQLDRLSGGASQETYRLEVRAGNVERTLALRRAAGGADPDPDGLHPGLATEAELMRTARAAGIPEPEVLAVLEPADGLGPGFLMEWLEGETLGPRIVRSESFARIRPRLAFQCGEIAARIHGVDTEATGLAQRLRTVSPEEFVRETHGNYRRLVDAGASHRPMIDYTALWLLEHLPEPGPPRLVHNDFRNGNLMVDPEEGVVAVLDWELAHLGDPVRDLGWICCNSWRFGGDDPVGGFGSREDLLAGYASAHGSAPDDEHLRFWEVFGSFWWAVGTLGMAHQYRVGPDRTVERPAIGRRTSECQMDCVNLLFPGPFEIETPEPEAPGAPRDLADAVDLLSSVRDFLRTEVPDATSGRTRFLARVASNSLDVVLREQGLEGRHLEREAASLEALGCAPEDPGALLTDRLHSQRAALVRKMEAGETALNDPALQNHLRRTVAQQLAVDQPSYSALRRPG